MCATDVGDPIFKILYKNSIKKKNKNQLDIIRISQQSSTIKMELKKCTILP